MHWNKVAIDVTWRLRRNSRIEEQQDAIANSKKHRPICAPANLMKAKDAAIEMLSSIEVINVKRGFKNSSDHKRCLEKAPPLKVLCALLFFNVTVKHFEWSN